MRIAWALSLALTIGCTQEVGATRSPAPTQAQDGSAESTYPATRRGDVVETLHGRKIADPYRWLEDGSNPEVAAWMEAQDAYTRKHLAALSGRQGLEKRLIEVTYIDSISPPTRRGDYYFYTRAHADKEKSIHYYRRGEDGAEQVLIDPNALSDDGSVAVRGISPSRDGRLVAYKLSENNADASTIRIRDLESGRDLEADVIDGAKYAWASWTPDSRGFYYTRVPTDPSIAATDLAGHAEVRFHRVGDDPAKDALVSPATGDPEMFLGGYVSWDGHFFLLTHRRGADNTVYFQDLRRRKGRPARPGKFVPLVDEFEASYSVSVYQDRFYVTTDYEAPNGRVFKVDPRRPQRDAWKQIVRMRDDALEAAYVVGGKLVLSYLRDAYDVLEIHRLDGTFLRDVGLPGPGSASGLIGRQDEDDAYFYYSSYTVAPEIYKTSVTEGRTSLWSKIEYPVDTSQFEQKQVRYKSKDGIEVTMFVVHKKGLDLDGSHPTLLTGYGGFNRAMTPWFSPRAVVWAEHGGVWAVPNLRGGGEYGEGWHQAGMLEHKQNVFNDFVAAAEYLVAQGYTTPDKLAIAGSSNGGLLVGAAMTQRPDLFRAVVCSVPLLDMLRYHLFGSGQTWIPEYGDPRNPDHFAFLYAYSPYHRIAKADYPALLMLSADSDDRVDPMHARKFLAAIQAQSTSGRPAILRVERKAGHGGAGTRKAGVAATVDRYAFLLHELGAVVAK